LSQSQLAYGLENQHASVCNLAQRTAGEHVSVDGTVIEACPGHKGFESKDDKDGEGETGLIFSIVSVNWRSGIRREGYMWI
jgi:hypothetical protein